MTRFFFPVLFVLAIACNPIASKDDTADRDDDGYDVITDGDCNNDNAAIHPGADEICNSMDDNCDGTIDENVTSLFYADTDGDGYGDAFRSVPGCEATSGFVANPTDCNDYDASINPGADEICNGIDDNCDDMIDEGC